jgi:hypothetical protein
MAKTVQQSGQLVIRDCGLAGYGQILSIQQELLAARQEDSVPNTILVVEHHPVITLGARKSENKLLADDVALRAKGIEIITIGRGGGTTAHNPGQLVIYPIVKLKSLRIDVTEFVRRIEQLGLELLAQLGVTADRKKGLPGLWVGDEDRLHRRSDQKMGHDARHRYQYPERPVDFRLDYPVRAGRRNDDLSRPTDRQTLRHEHDSPDGSTALPQTFLRGTLSHAIQTQTSRMAQSPHRWA